MVVPPLPALLADPSRQLLSDLRPFLRADAAHELDDRLVFLVGPRTLGQTGVENFRPSVKALHFRLPDEVIRHELPILSVQIGNCHTKGFILFKR
jgi:hypothetical protein